MLYLLITMSILKNQHGLPLQPTIGSCIGGHNKACLTGSQVQSPAPDGNGAVIGAEEEVQACDILGIKFESTIPAFERFLSLPVPSISMPADWAGNGCLLCINLH